MEDAQKQEQVLEEHIAQGNIDDAVKALYDLIVYYAKAKNFLKAEELRERLMEVNSLALTEIIKSAEIIEAEKTASIDKKHQEIWQDLYDFLTKEEGNALYHALEKIDLDPDQSILTQGKTNNRLFFLDSGNLQITFKQENALEFVKKLGPGETAGQDTFFPISLCTTTATTAGGVQIKYLPREKFDAISASFPGFADKLESYCRKKEGTPIEAILKNKEVERRRHDRLKCSGKITCQLLNNEGKPLSSPFAGFIDDISKGGLSFSIKCSKKSTARMLLGRPAQLTLEMQIQDAPTKQQYICQIVSLKHHMFTDYSVHVRFNKPLTEPQMTGLDVSV
jgi:CRP-like cAMP-binding protein